MATLAENNRLNILAGVCEKFATLMEASRGEIELTITSAAVSRLLSGASTTTLAGADGSTLLETRSEDSTEIGECYRQIGI